MSGCVPNRLEHSKHVQRTDLYELSAAELQWLAGHVQYARDIGINPSNEDSISEYFDSARDAVNRGTESPEIGNTVVNVVGVLVGELLCAQSALRWRIFADKQGTDLCLHDAGTSWTLFPQSSAAKRCEAREAGWVRPFLTWARESVSNPPR